MAHMTADDLFEIVANDISKTLESKNVEDVLESSMIAYGTHIIENRSIPSMLDGLKPVQRRALYTFKNGGYIGSKIKLARMVGDCMGVFHPHGDSSICSTVHNLVQTWKNNFPLLEGHGEWGAISGASPSAMRYIEVQMTDSISKLLFSNLEKNGVVSWSKTYDDSNVEPDFLPVKYPYHLINGSSGIAYSMGTCTPSYNIKELTNLFIYMLENKFYEDEFNIDEHKQQMKNIVKGVDFPIGTNIYNKDGDYLFDSSFGIGMRATLDINSKKNQIKITNIPVDLATDKLKDDILNLALEVKKVKSGKKTIEIQKDQSEVLMLKHDTPVISHYELDNNGKAIYNKPMVLLTFKNSADLNVESMKLMSKAGLNTSIRANINVINHHGIPTNVSLFQNAKTFLRFRFHCELQGFRHDKAKLESQIHLLEGIQIVTRDKEKLFSVLRNSEDLKNDLKLNWDELTEEQIAYILDMKIPKLTKSESTILDQQISEKHERVSEINNLMNEEALFDLIKEDYISLSETPMIKNCVRQSAILDDAATKINYEDMILDKPIIFMLMEDNTCGLVDGSKRITNKGGSLHRTSATSAALAVKSVDDKECKVLAMYNGMIKDSCYFITNTGRVFHNQMWKFTDRFSNIKNFLSLDKNENIIKIVKDDETLISHLLIITRNKIKNIRLDLFKNTHADRGVIAIKLEEGDKIVDIKCHHPDNKENVLLITSDGKLLMFNKDDVVESIGKTALGRRSINNKHKVIKAFLINSSLTSNVILSDEDVISDIDSDIDINTNEKLKYGILLVSDIGKGKVFNVEQLSLKKIGQVPVFAFSNNLKNGNLIDGWFFNAEENNVLSLISDSGEVSKTKVNNLTIISRSAKGAIKLISNDLNKKIMATDLEIIEENIDEEIEKVLSEKNSIENQE